MGPLKEGMTGTAPDGTRVIVRGGKIVPFGGPAGTTPRPEYGPNAYETSDGAILAPTKGGAVQTLRGPQIAAAEARTRLELGLGPVMAAQTRLARSEAGGENPYNRDWGARMLEAVPFDGGVAARIAGGQDYQDYEQAARTFESSILPIFSGAAVTESEAKRFVRANLPQLGDTPATLKEKADNRKRIINAAAKLTGRPIPFPDLNVWAPEGQTVESSGRMGVTGRKMAADAARSRRSAQAAASGPRATTVKIGGASYTVREK